MQDSVARLRGYEKPEDSQSGRIRPAFGHCLFFSAYLLDRDDFGKSSTIRQHIMALPTPPITTLTMTGVTSYRVTPAALITVAPELPKSCATSWVFEIGNDGYVLQNFDYITDFEKCLPLPLASRGTEYSPGICRSGLEIKTVTQILEVLDGGSTTETNWKTFCCSSYVYECP